MGGKTKISGGMSAAEHEKLLADERRYQKEQEDFRRAQALQDEKDRMQRAADEKDRLAAEEQARIANIKDQEAMAVTEGEGQDAANDKQKIKNLDFFTALGTGVVNQGNKPK
jgi:hypothetical protein